jgi:predicted amidohydrolase
MSIPASREEFEAEARRYLRQAQAKAAGITVFPEGTGLMLAPPLISGFKLGFVKREDEGKQPGAGFLSRSLGSLAGTTASALGGGFRGSLGRLVRKNSDAYRELYAETFSTLAREFGTAIVGGSLYLYDEEVAAVRHRAYVFDANGEILGYQDKLNLDPDEEELATPGTELSIVPTRFGRLGILIGRDILYPELARLLAIQGADLVLGIVASPGAAQAAVVRSALALRADENQVFAAASFLIGPNYLGREKRTEFYGQSAVLAPISLTVKGDGVLVQAGTNRTESLIAAELDGEALEGLRQTSRFRPRQQMNLGSLGPVLAEMYGQGLTVEGAIAQGLAGPVEAEPSWIEVEPEVSAAAGEPAVAEEPVTEGVEEEPAFSRASVPEAMSLGRPETPEEEA